MGGADNYALLAGLVAVVVDALAAGAWYARRRCIREGFLLADATVRFVAAVASSLANPRACEYRLV